MRKVWDGTAEPSASLYVLFPRKSASRSVPVRINVSTTSAGMLTSDAPLSTMKFSVRTPLIKTGTTKTPLRLCSGISDVRLCRGERFIAGGAGAGNVSTEEARLIENAAQPVPPCTVPSKVIPPSFEVPDRPTITYPGGWEIQESG